MSAARLAAANELSHWAECARAWRQPCHAGRLYPVLIGRAGAVSSATGGSWDAAEIQARQMGHARDGAYLLLIAADAAVLSAAHAAVMSAASAVAGSQGAER